MGKTGSYSKWSFFLDFLIGEKNKKELGELHSISYPTVVKYDKLCKEIVESNKKYTGILLDTIDFVYVTESSLHEFTTRITNFSDIIHLKGTSNTFFDLPNKHEVLLRYHQLRYAMNHVRIQHAIVIEGNTVTAMIQNHVFENLGNFSTMDYPLILEAYQPELIILFSSVKDDYSIKNQLDFLAMKNHKKKMLVEFDDSSALSLAMANWGFYEEVDSVIPSS